MSARFQLQARIKPEDELQADILHALRVMLPNDAVLNYWELRNARDAREGARRRRLGALKGWPDLGIFWRERVALLELKREKYGQVSPEQAHLHQRLYATGFPVAVVRTIDDALQAVMAAGIPLRGKIAA